MSIGLQGMVLAAAINGNEAELQEFIDRGGNLDATTNLSDGSVRGISLLMMACFHGQERIVEMLLTAPKPVSLDMLQDSYGTRALTYAAAGSKAAPIVQRLLDAKADVSRCNFKGISKRDAQTRSAAPLPLRARDTRHAQRS